MLSQLRYDHTYVSWATDKTHRGRRQRRQPLNLVLLVKHNEKPPKNKVFKKNRIRRHRTLPPQALGPLTCSHKTRLHPRLRPQEFYQVLLPGLGPVPLPSLVPKPRHQAPRRVPLPELGTRACRFLFQVLAPSFKPVPCVKSSFPMS